MRANNISPGEKEIYLLIPVEFTIRNWGHSGTTYYSPFTLIFR